MKISEVSAIILMNGVEDILDHLKIQSGKFKLEIAEFQVETLVKELKFVFEDQCKQKGLGFSIECSKGKFSVYYVLGYRCRGICIGY